MAALHQLLSGAFRTILLYLSLHYYLALFNAPRAINFLHTKRPLNQYSHPTPNSDQETPNSKQSASADNECVVCLSVLHDVVVGKVVRRLRCGHNFHGNCLHTWLTLGSSTCPHCRLPLSPEHALQFEDSCVHHEDLLLDH